MEPLRCNTKLGPGMDVAFAIMNVMPLHPCEHLQLPERRGTPLERNRFQVPPSLLSGAGGGGRGGEGKVVFCFVLV